jgi:hypothetical protein
MTRGELIEAVAEAWNSETADCSKPKCRTCSIAAATVIDLVLEEAAKVADAAGADAIASVIRALKGKSE